MALPSSETLHVSSVAIGGRAVLIEGASGMGKSDLALRLIDRGATLISDDYTLLTRVEGALVASAPATIAGRIEIRGLGIVPLPHTDSAPVALAVRLSDAPERLPMGEDVRRIAGVGIRSVAIDARSASAPIKVELALKHLCGAAT
ncbi:MAG: aldolase [Sphingomonas sp.]|uniref:HPr kinase/phosphorylase n=1 Tax=Sphingomonas sp. TaxID=28214 RepID=UPI00120235A0|nr:HPr kinase/phosphatase C-terminal domain-containing protein [Sphingomonas sp.]THD36639.1 MAG: aldolase [Sphingomonas sp.]